MKMFIHFILTLYIACSVGSIAYAETVIDIEAHIDGRDQLIINRNTVQWHHFDFAAVGRHIGANSPTIIYTTERGGEWLPDWPEPHPDEIRFEALSSVFNNLTPAFPTDGVPWSVTTLLGRGEVNIIEQPSTSNDFTLVVEIDDNPFGGSRFYAIRLSYGIGETVIVDNKDAQFSKCGYWKVSDKATGFYGTDYRYAYGGDGSAVATFMFEIPTNGNYQIAAQWPAHGSRAPDAPFTIINNDTVIDTVLMDQRINGGQFNPLNGPASINSGTYKLSAGVLEVTLSNDASGKVAADAVQVVSK